MLTRSRRDLKKILRYLVSTKRIPHAMLGVALTHSEKMDVENEKNWRVFCEIPIHVEMQIDAAANLDQLPHQARVGVLLHEIGHIHLDARYSDQDEVRVDVWCAKIPKAEYTYVSKVEYYDHLTKENRFADNLEMVSERFVDLVHQPH